MTAGLSGNENDQPYRDWNARALALLEQLKSHQRVHVYGIAGLSRCHRMHADSLMLRGETDRARKVLEEDLAFVKSVPVAEAAFPEIVLSEVLALAALGRWSRECPQVHSSIEPPPANIIIQDPERDLAELAARRVGWLPSLTKSPWLTPDDLSSQAWADQVISVIKMDAAAIHRDRSRISAVAWWLRPHLQNRLALERRVGKLGDAHRIADRFTALAERLTQSFPDQAAAHMLLSESYVQKAKNAYREDDAPVIEMWERKALDAAIRAATLNWENDEAQALLKNRCARLRKLAAKL
jgi:hypothetical protein